MFKPPRLSRAIKDPRISDRWVITPWAKNERWKTSRIEIKPNDLDGMRPFGSGLVEADPQAAQLYLRDEVVRGEAIELRFQHERPGDEPIPFYVAVHNGHPIGETSEQFGRMLHRRLAINGTVYSWPSGLSRLRLDGTETVVGLESEGKAFGLGTAGLWRRPRLVGMGVVRWHDDDCKEEADDERA